MQCSTQLPMRVGLLCTAKIHKHVTRLHSAYHSALNESAVLQHTLNAVTCNLIHSQAPLLQNVNAEVVQAGRAWYFFSHMSTIKGSMQKRGRKTLIERWHI